MTTTSVTSGVTSTSVTVNDGDELDVLYGGTASGTMVEFEGAQVVFDGGLALVTVVDFIGTEVVSSGGHALGTTVDYGGAQVVSSGGIAAGTTVNAAGSVYVEDGGLASLGVYTNSGQIFVSAGGESDTTSVGDGGTEAVSAGGFASASQIGVGGVQVLSGGKATDTHVTVDGLETVSSGGFDDRATLDAGGGQEIASHGLAADGEINVGGDVVVDSGGKAISETLNGGTLMVQAGGGVASAAVSLGGLLLVDGVSLNTDIQAGGQVTIDSGGYSESDTITGGTLTVEAGGEVQSATISQGGLLLVEGVSSQTHIDRGGTEAIDAGGTANGTTLLYSTQLVAGGTASGTDAELGRIEVQAGGTAVDAVVGLAAQLVVDAGGAASGTVLNGFVSAVMTVSVGGLAVGTQNTNGGEEDVYGTTSSGSLFGVGYLGVTGYQYVYDGGLSIAEDVYSYGTQVVEDGGIASATLLYDPLGGAVQTVSAGGFALATIVSSGGIQAVAGNASGSVVDGGEIDVAAGGQIFAAEIGLSGTQTVSADGSASGTAVASGGVLYIYGTTTGTTVNTGGKETVLSGGVASGSVVDGVEMVSSGGLASGAMIGDGAVQTLDGGSATATQIGAGGFQFLIEGGASVDAAVTSGGQAIVLSGGTETGAAVGSGGVETVFDSGEAAASVIAFSGTLTVSSGGTDTLSEIAAGGSATIEAGGTEAFVNVDAGGAETVFGRTLGVIVDGTQTVTGSGATTTGTTVDGGDQLVQDGGTASGTMVGGIGGAIDEYAGGTASGSVVSAGGNDIVHADGVASGSMLVGGRQVVSAGGLAVGTTVGSGGHQFVEDGGTATDTAIQSGGVEVVSAGGIANGTVVGDGATEIVSSGGVVVGSTEVAVGGTLTVADGALFDGMNATVTLDAGAQLVVGAGDVLDLANIPLADHGDILLAGNTYGGGVATLRVTGDVSLSGGGTVSLYDLGGYSNAGVIVGTDSGALLDNVDNTISGWGLLGGGMLALTNEAAGVVDAASQILDLHTGRTVFNRGLLEATTGTLLIEDGVDNAGTISAAGGLVRLGSEANAAVIRGGSLDSTGDGSVEVTNAAALDGSSNPVSVSARLLVDSTATLTLTGAIANSGTINLNGNTYGGGVATLRIQGAATLSGGGAVQLRDFGGYMTAGVIAGSSTADSLENAGNTISGWGLLGGGALSFTNDAGGVVDADTAGQTLFVDTGAGALVNRGLLEATGGTLDIAGGLLNDGTVEQGASGLLSLEGPVGGTGTIALDGPSLTLGAAIGTGQTVSFAAGGAETLVLADPGGFGGTVSGFGPDDAIDVQGATATLSYAAGTAGGPGSLVLSAGGAAVATLAVAGSYAGETFVATPSADGTLVRVVQAAVSAQFGTLTVAPLAGGTVSLGEILADPAYATGGRVAALVVDGAGTVVATADATIADVRVESGTLRLAGQTISTNTVEITAGSFDIGVQNGATAAVDLDGGSLTVNGALTVGGAGSGTLDLESGGMVTAEMVTIGQAAGGAGTVVLGPGATLVSMGQLDIGAQGKVEMQGGVLDPPLITIDDGGEISGFGTLVGDVLDNGTFVAQGGAMDVTGSFTGMGGITVGSGSSLEIGGGVSSGMMVSFGGGGSLVLDDAPDVHGSIIGFGTGDSVDLTGVTLAQGDFSSDGTNSYVTAGPVAFELAGYTGPLEVDANGGVAACYCRGTHIQTKQGETAIEDLAIGDIVRTNSGTLRAIRWIGRRAYHGRFVAGRRDILPIRILAGALAAGVPRRDLDVSPQHAMYLEELLVPAIDLVNGTTVIQRTEVASVEYYHVELDSHDVILAEGAPSESFIDDGSRMMFQNATDFARLYPDAPATPARYCAPRVTSGYALERIRRLLALRGEAQQQKALMNGP